MAKLWCTFFFIIRRGKRRLWSKRWFLRNLGAAFCQLSTQQMEQKASLFIFAFWFQLLLYLVSFCLCLLASLRFLNRGYQGGSCLSQNCLALPMLLCRFGELTAITNIGRTGRRARSEKTASDGSVPTIFVWDCGFFTLLYLLNQPPSPPSFCFQGQLEPVVGSFSAHEISRLPHK